VSQILQMVGFTYVIGLMLVLSACSTIHKTTMTTPNMDYAKSQCGLNGGVISIKHSWFNDSMTAVCGNGAVFTFDGDYQ